MIAACCVCISFVRRQKQMFYLDDHNPNSTQIETEHERQQRRISAAEANAFAVDNRPPTPFSGLSKYQSGWLIKGFAKAGVELDERKKEMAESLLNMFGEVSDAALLLFTFFSLVQSDQGSLERQNGPLMSILNGSIIYHLLCDRRRSRLRRWTRARSSHACCERTKRSLRRSPTVRYCSKSRAWTWHDDNDLGLGGIRWCGWILTGFGDIAIR